MILLVTLTVAHAVGGGLDLVDVTVPASGRLQIGCFRTDVDVPPGGAQTISLWRPAADDQPDVIFSDGTRTAIPPAQPATSMPAWWTPTPAPYRDPLPPDPGAALRGLARASLVALAIVAFAWLVWPLVWRAAPLLLVPVLVAALPGRAIAPPVVRAHRTVDGDRVDANVIVEAPLGGLPDFPKGAWELTPLDEPASCYRPVAPDRWPGPGRYRLRGIPWR